MKLSSLGWSAEFESKNTQEDKLARIIAVHRSHLRAMSLNGELNLHYSQGIAERPAVGDWVTISPIFIDEQNEPAALIKELIARRSKISRVAVGSHIEEQVIAANLDTVFVVTSVNQDFNLNRLQRYLLLIKEGGAKPVVILSKIDLNSSYTDLMEEIRLQLDEDILVFPLSVVDKTGIDQIKFLMPEASTSVFVGSSGVGKSSLVNCLLNQEIQIVKEIRSDDDKGRHATTSRQMFFIPNGGMIIDTPGVRELSVFGSEDNLSDAFSGIEELISQCKYSDCGHTTEPGCAIIFAIEHQQLEQRQWDNYNKLSREIAYNNNKLNKELSSNAKKRWKKIQTDYKARKKFKGKN